MPGPISWTIRGIGPNWNWKRDGDDQNIEYQTRFSAKNVAHVHRGAGDSAPLLATIRIEEQGGDAQILIPDDTSGDDKTTIKRVIRMNQVSDEGYIYRWPVKFHSLDDRELQWGYEHPAYGNNDVELRDLSTNELLGTANDQSLELLKELPEAAVEEFVITGTAVQIHLLGYQMGDMPIAAEGPEGRDRWKDQLDWFEDDFSPDVEELRRKIKEEEDRPAEQHDNTKIGH